MTQFEKSSFLTPVRCQLRKDRDRSPSDTPCYRPLNGKELDTGHCDREPCGNEGHGIGYLGRRTCDCLGCANVVVDVAHVGRGHVIDYCGCRPCGGGGSSAGHCGPNISGL